MSRILLRTACEADFRTLCVIFALYMYDSFELIYLFYGAGTSRGNGDTTYSV